jgi:hypothetical protein
MSLSFVELKVVVGRFFFYPSGDPVCSPTFKNKIISKHFIHLHDTCFVFMHSDLLLTCHEKERQRDRERERERETERERERERDREREIAASD